MGLSEYVCVLWLVVWPLLGAVVGRNFKGRTQLGAALGLLLGPIGILTLFLMGDNRRYCPACRSMVDPQATVCRFCGGALKTQGAQGVQPIPPLPPPRAKRAP